MTKIGIISSGGDAPGMNAATRAIVRRAIREGIEVYSFEKGFDGLLDEEIEHMTSRSVGNILQLGGTIIKTGRCERFFKEEWVKKGAEILDKHEFDGFIACGGNGTMHGLHALSKHWDGRIIGLPGTIDNDIYGSDNSIGFDTAVNTAMEAIDKVRDTAFSHERSFIIEVMGRQRGFIALRVALAGGCEEVLVPEFETDLNEVVDRYNRNKEKGKRTNILVLAEGAIRGKGANFLKDYLESQTNDKWRIVVIGYLQRGGKPTANDRNLATRLGAFAVETFIDGETDVMVGEVNQQLTKTPLEDVFNKDKPTDKYTYDLITIVQ